MREIKFRICHETNSDKTIIYPDEHSDDYMDDYMIGIDGTVYENYGTKDKPLWENVFDATVFVQQYTGLKDKNGKDIYEGDIFKDDYWWVGEATVEYANGMFGFEGGEGETLDFRPMPLEHHYFDRFYSGTQVIECDHIEVIGNIFEGLDNERD